MNPPDNHHIWLREIVAARFHISLLELDKIEHMNKNRNNCHLCNAARKQVGNAAWKQVGNVKICFLHLERMALDLISKKEYNIMRRYSK